MAAPTMTFEEFKQSMIAYAKEVQGDRYPGDDYYLERCWRENWEHGESPSDAVISDMGYWE